MQNQQAAFKLSNGVYEYLLENDLKALIKRIPSSSTESIRVFYLVGSGNETLGIMAVVGP